MQLGIGAGVGFVLEVGLEVEDVPEVPVVEEEEEEEEASLIISDNNFSVLVSWRFCSPHWIALKW